MVLKGSVWTEQCGILKRTPYVVARTKLDRRVTLFSARGVNGGVIQMRGDLQLPRRHQMNVQSKLCMSGQYDKS
jgi:hypothetical protein